MTIATKRLGYRQDGLKRSLCDPQMVCRFVVGVPSSSYFKAFRPRGIAMLRLGIKEERGEKRAR